MHYQPDKRYVQTHLCQHPSQVYIGPHYVSCCHKSSELDLVTAHHVVVNYDK